MKSVVFAVLLSFLAVGIVNAETTITIKGSDTLVRLGQRWAEEYMKSHPDVVIQVSGGGSGTGIAALISSRAFKISFFSGSLRF